MPLARSSHPPRDISGRGPRPGRRRPWAESVCEPRTKLCVVCCVKEGDESQTRLCFHESTTQGEMVAVTEDIDAITAAEDEDADDNGTVNAPSNIRERQRYAVALDSWSTAKPPPGRSALLRRLRSPFPTSTRKYRTNHRFDVANLSGGLLRDKERCPSDPNCRSHAPGRRDSNQRGGHVYHQ